MSDLLSYDELLEQYKIIEQELDHLKNDTFVVAPVNRQIQTLALFTVENIGYDELKKLQEEHNNFLFTPLNEKPVFTSLEKFLGHLESRKQNSSKSDSDT